MNSLLDAATKGLGVYSISEAARYAKVPRNTVRSWFFPQRGREPMRRGDISDPGEKALTFLDLVEVLAVRSLRVDYKVTMRTVRQAIDFAQTEHGVEHIFARKDHRTFLDEHRQLHLVLSGEKNPIALSGKGAGQQSMIECVEGYMLDLSFGGDGLAEVYTAFRFESQKVLMKPVFQFGQPIMEENGYPAEVLWNAVLSEGSFERAADAYDASVASVEAAYRYCHSELGLLAA